MVAEISESPQTHHTWLTYFVITKINVHDNENDKQFVLNVCKSCAIYETQYCNSCP